MYKITLVGLALHSLKFPTSHRYIFYHYNSLYSFASLKLRLAL